jgi:hypothetical protein
MTPEELSSPLLAFHREESSKNVFELMGMPKSGPTTPTKQTTPVKTEAVKKEVRMLTHLFPVYIEHNLQDSQKSSLPYHPAADYLYNVIIDTTAQHGKHFFDVNCKICTGKVPMPTEEKKVEEKKEEVKEEKQDMDMYEAHAQVAYSVPEKEEPPKSEPPKSVPKPIALPPRPKDDELYLGTPIWKGFIYAHEVVKFMSHGSIVSGDGKLLTKVEIESPVFVLHADTFCFLDAATCFDHLWTTGTRICF